MIPMQCPKCGRRGNVPPDRLASRLSCKACGAVFHYDSTGHLVLGEPPSPDKPRSRPSAQTRSEPMEFDFDIKEAWANAPMGAKLALPAVLVFLVAWQFLFTGGGTAGHIASAERIARAVLSNDKSTVTAMATPETAEAAGQWFDLVRKEVEEKQVPGGVVVMPSLLSGNADADSALTVSVSLPGADSGFVAMNLDLKRAGGSWQFDANNALNEAQKAAAANAPSPGGSRRK